jgi:predicted porin
MKKSLVALAVLAAAGAASAQSSVTLFGIVDATLAIGRGELSDRTRLQNSGYNSSRLGFRGTEDLGGGLSASFWLEAGINNDDGGGQATNTNNQFGGSPNSAGTVFNGGAVSNGGQGLTFNRRSTVSLSGGFGEIRLGRDYTPNFTVITTYDPFGTNGVGTTNTLNGVSTASTSAGGLNPVTAVRASNSIGYFLPANLGGFNGQAMYYFGENAQATPAVATEDDGTGFGLRLGYAAGPLSASVGMNSVKYAAGDVKSWSLGGSWDFGIARAMAQYVRDSVDGVAGAADVDGKGWLIGGLFPIGAGEIRASFSQYEVDLVGAADPRSRKLALGYVHNLSKRTAVYTTYARVRNSGGGSYALNGSTTGVNASSTGFDLGIRHAF